MGLFFSFQHSELAAANNRQALKIHAKILSDTSPLEEQTKEAY